MLNLAGQSGGDMSVRVEHMIAPLLQYGNLRLEISDIRQVAVYALEAFKGYLHQLCIILDCEVTPDSSECGRIHLANLRTLPDRQVSSDFCEVRKIHLGKLRIEF